MIIVFLSLIGATLKCSNCLELRGSCFVEFSSPHRSRDIYERIWNEMSIGFNGKNQMSCARAFQLVFSIGFDRKKENGRRKMEEKTIET